MTEDRGVLWTSGFDHPHTGVGVIQRRLDVGLTRLGWTVERGLSRPVTGHPVRAKARQAIQTATSDAVAALVTMSPAPLRMPIPTAALVYDLRWLRTASLVKRMYRQADLKLTIRSAQAIVVISDRTRTDLLDLHPACEDLVSVLPLGPGHFDSVPEWPTARATGTTLLVGGAPHKRNDVAIEALARARPDWAQSIVGVGLSRSTEALAIERFGASRCTFHHEIDAQELRTLYLAAEVFVLLSTEEGFGFPYVEALAAGCQVVAVDQPVTRELLGDAAVLVRDGSADDIARQLRADFHRVPAPRRRGTAETFSWSQTSATADAAIQQAVGAGRS